MDVEQDSEVGGTGWIKWLRRKLVGVGSGEGRSGSILRFALSEVRNAVVAR